ncbi:hypothetical protein K456DRAFT_711131 [Colletotrichum gloeosporioides 23]|nr:hypothetical protein K456DRAFT_711131 [Colletotrichum gloeosporioides 23]
MATSKPIANLCDLPAEHPATETAKTQRRGTISLRYLASPRRLCSQTCVRLADNTLALAVVMVAVAVTAHSPPTPRLPRLMIPILQPTDDHTRRLLTHVSISTVPYTRTLACRRRPRRGRRRRHYSPPLGSSLAVSRSLAGRTHGSCWLLEPLEGTTTAMLLREACHAPPHLS